MALLDDYQQLRQRLIEDVREAWQFTENDPVYVAPMESEPNADRWAVIQKAGPITNETYTAGVNGLERMVWTFDVTGAFRRPTGVHVDDFLAGLAFDLRAKVNPATEAPGSGYASVASYWVVNSLDWEIGDPQDAYLRVTAQIQFEVHPGRLD